MSASFRGSWRSFSVLGMYLAIHGSILCKLAVSGGIWPYLAISGNIWRHLETIGSERSTRTTKRNEPRAKLWRYLRFLQRLRTSVASARANETNRARNEQRAMRTARETLSQMPDSDQPFNIPFAIGVAAPSNS